MASQAHAIPLHHRPHDAVYRLLELPIELQSLLESDSAPVLTLESSHYSALLRTPASSYLLRQKNTSNAFILLSTPPAGHGLSAISTIHETVELDLVPEATTNRVPLRDTGSGGKWHERFGKNR